MESILNSVKKALGIAPDYDAFDPEITMHINSVFMVLNQLGVGPAKPFRIKNAIQVWEQFLPLGDMDAVRTYVFLRVKMLFDPPQNSSVQQAYDAQMREYEWRLNTMADYVYDGERSETKVYDSIADAENAVTNELNITAGSIICVPEDDRYLVYNVVEGEDGLKLVPVGGTES